MWRHWGTTRAFWENSENFLPNHRWHFTENPVIKWRPGHRQVHALLHITDSVSDMSWVTAHSTLIIQQESLIDDLEHPWPLGGRGHLHIGRVYLTGPGSLSISVSKTDAEHIRHKYRNTPQIHLSIKPIICQWDKNCLLDIKFQKMSSKVHN